MMAKISKAYDDRAGEGVWKKTMITIMIVLLCIFVAIRISPYSSNTVSSYGTYPVKDQYIRAVTWNIAAVNNNPFEYWITNDDPRYNVMMKSVSDFIESPGDKDVSIDAVFSPEMYDELEGLMRGAGWTGLEETRKIWEEDYRKRKIISGFIKDDLIGKKRLASMPDRVTNTINTPSGDVITRPAVINCYTGDLGSLATWWGQWKDFFFTKTIPVSRNGQVQNVQVYKNLNAIKKAKYPSLTSEEEAISIPLQTVCMAIFDSILVHMMNQIAPVVWQEQRKSICTKLNLQKNDRTVEILEKTYGDSDLIFLQEVAGRFPQFIQSKPISEIFDIKQAASMDPDRDQNSFILLRKGKYEFVKEITEEVIAFYGEMSHSAESELPAKLPVVNGDLIAILVVDITDNTKYVLASFHGDTNGLATKPVVTAVRDYTAFKQPDSHMLFGLDANTYANPESDQQGVTDFAKFYTENKLDSCYGPNPNPLNFTTFHARTHLQTQLNKVSTVLSLMQAYYIHSLCVFVINYANCVGGST